MTALDKLIEVAGAMRPNYFTIAEAADKLGKTHGATAKMADRGELGFDLHEHRRWVPISEIKRILRLQELKAEVKRLSIPGASID